MAAETQSIRRRAGRVGVSSALLCSAVCACLGPGPAQVQRVPLCAAVPRGPEVAPAADSPPNSDASVDGGASSDGGNDLGATGTLPLMAGQSYPGLPPFEPEGSVTRWGLTGQVVYDLGAARRLVVEMEENGEAAGLLIVRVDGADSPRVVATYAVDQGGEGASIKVTDAWSDMARRRLVLLARIDRRSRGSHNGAREYPPRDDVSWLGLVVDPLNLRVALPEVTLPTTFSLVPSTDGVSLVLECGDSWALGTDSRFHPPSTPRCPRASFVGRP